MSGMVTCPAASRGAPAVASRPRGIRSRARSARPELEGDHGRSVGDMRRSVEIKGPSKGNQGAINGPSLAQARVARGGAPKQSEAT